MSVFSSNVQDYEEYKDEYVMNTAEKQLILAMSRNDVTKVKEMIFTYDQEDEINIFISKDTKCYTILHLATLNHHIEIIKLAINYAKSSKKDLNDYEFSLKMNNWINSKSFEGFTALHLASFRGDLLIMEELVQNGANIHDINDQGLNCLHIAAQGDQPVSLVFFKMKGLDINSKDYKGSTPLHWASYIGCENAVNYIVNWSVNINEKDKEGELTPLHLAVISGNTRVVRRLLIKGSDKTLRDKLGKSAADLARDNGFNNILKMLEAKTGISEMYNIAPVFKPMRKKKRSLVMFCLLFIVVNIISIFFNFPYVSEHIWFVLFSLFNFLTLVFFFLSWKRDPGYIQKTSARNLLEILRKYDCASVCPECEIVKLARSKHCEICGRCISVYDHHCPWINNCVGAKNHGCFLSFILSVWTNILFQLIMTLYHIYIVHPSDILPNMHDINDMDFFPFKLVMNTFNVIIMLIFFFPLSVLVYVQINNFILNKTTPERYGFNVNNKDERSVTNSGETNPSFIDLSKSESKKSLKIRRNLSGFDYIRNCFTMCCMNARQKSLTLPEESKNSLLIAEA